MICGIQAGRYSTSPYQTAWTVIVNTRDDEGYIKSSLFLAAARDAPRNCNVYTVTALTAELNVQSFSLDQRITDSYIFFRLLPALFYSRIHEYPLNPLTGPQAAR